MNILGISGSLRRDSYNSKLLHISRDLLPDGNHLKIFDISQIPLYNADLDTESKPGAVVSLLESIVSCDGLLIATPEYNYSIPGVLKNLIDWASRPAYKSVLAGKPTAVLSASKGPVGGARAQSQLRYVLAATLSPVLPEREYLLPGASDAFDESGELKDEKMANRLERYLNQFISWASTHAV